MELKVPGVLGSLLFDGEWITIRKKEAGSAETRIRLRAAEVTGVRHKPATRMMHGYVQFLLPGSVPVAERKGGLSAGRPPRSDPNSLSIPRRSNDAAEKLIAAVEQARI